MNKTSLRAATLRNCLAALCVAASALMSGCGGGSDNGMEPMPPAPATPPPVTAVIGPAGGTLNGPDGVQLVVPAGALDADVTLRIARSSDGAPPMPPEYGTVPPIYEITPHNQRFLLPVEVRLPLTTAETTVAALVAAPEGEWSTIEAPVRDGQVVLQRSELSYFSSGFLIPNVCTGTCNFAGPTMSGTATVSPASAEVVVGGGVIVRRLVARATVSATVNVRIPGDCSGPTLTVTRERWGGGSASPNGGRFVTETLLTAAPVTVSAPPGSPNIRVGTINFSNAVGGSTYTNLRYALVLRCTRNGQNRLAFAEFGYLLQIPPLQTPLITQQPADTQVADGSPVTFSVRATSAQPMTFEWERSVNGGVVWGGFAAPQGGGTVVPGGNDFTLSGPAASSNNGALFRVRVCASDGVEQGCVTSGSARLTVTPVAPTVSLTPSSSTVTAGGSATFNAVASGSAPLTYAWTLNGGSIGGGSFAIGNCSGTATLSGSGGTLQLGALTAGCNSATVAVAVSNAAGNASATAALSVGTNALQFQQPLTDQGATEGGTATFSYTLQPTGSTLFTQWRLNDSLLTSGSFTRGACTGSAGFGATQLQLSGLALGCNGLVVSVVVSDSFGNRAEGSARLAVTPVPVAVGATLVAGALGISGTADGDAATARFNLPNYLTRDPASGTIYVSDFFSSTVRAVSSTGEVSTLAGLAGQVGLVDGTGAAARFRGTGGIAIDTSGTLHVADWDNHAVRRIAAGAVVTTLAGGFPAGTADGTGVAARFRNPNGLAVDASGNVYVADWGNHTIRRITPTGETTTLAGAAGVSGSADGNGADARFNRPSGLAIDAAGNLYVADQNNHLIRRIASNGAVTTIAGTAGSAGNIDSTGAAARFDNPAWISVSPTGDLFVVSGAGDTVRKVTPAGVVTTVVGVAGYVGPVVLGNSPRLSGARGVLAVSSTLLVVAADRAIVRITLP